MAQMVTPQELAAINQRFAKEPLTDAYCIPMLAADGSQWIDSRSGRLDASSLAKFAKDAKTRGANLQLAHLGAVQPIPLGKVFDGAVTDGALYLKAYMPVGVNVPNVLGGTVKTDDVAAAYATGLADRVSIGFTFEMAQCNLCLHDVRSVECAHVPGESYQTEDGQTVQCSPLILAGETGTFHEVSLVWQGAIDTAKTIGRDALPTGLSVETNLRLDKQAVVPTVTECRLSVQQHLEATDACVILDAPTTAPTDEPELLALTHNSTLATTEPAWGAVDKSALPRVAFADIGEADKKSTWRYPHHWVQHGGSPGANGVVTTGTMYLHRGGLRAALASAGGARSGQPAPTAVKAHLNAHAKAIGMGEHQLALLAMWPCDPEILSNTGIEALMDMASEAEFAVCVEAIRDEQLRLALAEYEADENRLQLARQVEQVMAQVAALTPLAALGTRSLETAKAKALEAGVKALGNAFPMEFYETVFTQAVASATPEVMEQADAAWRAELAAKITPGRQSVDPDLPKAGADRAAYDGESPMQTFDRLVAHELSVHQWPDTRYGDAVRRVSRAHPDLVQALRTQ